MSLIELLRLQDDKISSVVSGLADTQVQLHGIFIFIIWF